LTIEDSVFRGVRAEELKWTQSEDGTEYREYRTVIQSSRVESSELGRVLEMAMERD
jgi:hypothetical protein